VYIIGPNFLYVGLSGLLLIQVKLDFVLSILGSVATSHSNKP
jgi:hypothetical protein